MPKNILLSCHKAVQVMKRLAGRIIFRFKVFIQLIMIIKLDLVSFSFIYSNYILSASLYILMYIYIFCKGNNKIMGIIFLFAIKHNVVHLHYIHKFPSCQVIKVHFSLQNTLVQVYLQCTTYHNSFSTSSPSFQPFKAC